MALNILKTFYNLALSTGKKRKRDVASRMNGEEEEGEGRDGAAVRKLRLTASAPEHQLLQRTAPTGPQQPAVRLHPDPHPPYYSPAFTFSVPHQPSAAAAAAPLPPSTGLHDKLRSLKASLDIRQGRSQQAAGHQHHMYPLDQHQQRQQGKPTPPAWASSGQQQQQQQEEGLLVSHGRPLVAKQLHADFNDAALARMQRSVGAATRSTSAPSLPVSSATRTQPTRRPLPPPPKSLNRSQYMNLVTQNLRAEQELQQWRALHRPVPKPIMTIDLTEDNDVDLQASRKAREEEQELHAQRERLQFNIQQRIERMAALEAQSSYALAEARAREITRKTEELNAKMRKHRLKEREIQKRAHPQAAQPSISATTQQQQQQQQQQRKAAVEEISLLSDEDEEPQVEEEEEEEGVDEEDYDQEVDQEDEELGWQAPEQNTPEELASWDLIFRKGPGQSHLDERLAYHEQSSIPLTRSKMRCLHDGDWLNDEVINVAMALLQERDTAARQRGSSFPKCHFFNSFFLNKLFKDAHAYKYANVRRWTLPKRLANYGQTSSCLFECDRLVVPVHCGQTHWACAMIDLLHRRLYYYDSLQGSHNGVLDHLAQWVVDEARDKLGEHGLQQWGDALSWPKHQPKDVPMQNNGSDCGVFAIKFAECVGTGRDFDFTCHHMPCIRRALAHRVLQLRI